MSGTIFISDFGKCMECQIDDNCRRHVWKHYFSEWWDERNSDIKTNLADSISNQSAKQPISQPLRNTVSENVPFMMESNYFSTICQLQIYCKKIYTTLQYHFRYSYVKVNQNFKQNSDILHWVTGIMFERIY